MAAPAETKVATAAPLDAAGVDAALSTLASDWTTHGQGHVFAFLPRLNLDQKRHLLADCKQVDVARVRTIFDSVKATKPKEEFKPFDKLTVKANSDAATQKKWYDAGLALVKAGKVGAVLMAGGQGTRLGSKDPKGCFEIGLPSNKSIFQLQAERITRLKHLAGGSKPLPWYIMTSGATHAPTVAYFQKHRFFGLPQEDVFFFQQGELPALNGDGRIIMQSMDRIALSPNGNGGLYTGLAKSGVLADMAKRGIEHVHLFGVDNVLVLPADPSFVGFCAESKSDVSNKVIIRSDPKEKVGAMCYRDGKPSVVEYSEIDVSLSEGKAADGSLLINQANIANHYFSREFLERVADQEAKLPYHSASKDIPTISSEGVNTDATTGKPLTVAGFKMELFVFDSFQFANNMTSFAVRRDEEFAPVKNKNRDRPAAAAAAPAAAGTAASLVISSTSTATGTATVSSATSSVVVQMPEAPYTSDSPDTARLALSQLHRRWAEAAGYSFAPEDADFLFEVSPLASYFGEALPGAPRRLNLRDPTQNQITPTSA